GSAVEIDQAELRGLDEATRQCDGAAVDLGLLEGHVVGLPLRAAGVGVCAREATLGNCHDCYVLRVSGAGRADEETSAHRLTWSGGGGCRTGAGPSRHGPGCAWRAARPARAGGPR